MATLSKLRIVMEVGTAGFTAGIKKVEAGLKGVTARLKTAAKASIDLRTALASVAGVGFVAKKLFDLGSAVEETGSKFNTVFGQSSKAVQGFIDNFATMAGLSNEAAQGILATTGSIARGMGFAQDASAQFATEIVKIAGDLASFNNIPIAETSLAIQAALTGEREQLKRMGIVVREVDVQQQAFANTGKTVAAELTNQEKATATLQLITERAGFAIGDLARTQDSAANQSRALGAELKNIADEIAVALLPVLSFVITKVGEFIKGIQIMAANLAVTIARINFWKEALLGTEESTMAANDQLRFMRQAAEEVKNEVVGLTNTVISFNRAAAETANVDSGFVVDMSGLADATLTLDDNIGKVAVTVQNNLRPSLRTAATQMEELRDAGLDFASGFANAIIQSTETGIDAFKNFANQVIRELIRIQLVQGITNAIASFGGGGGGGGGGTAASSAGAVASGLSAGSFGGGTPTGSGSAMVVNQAISFNLSAVDGRDMARALQENRGEIQKIVSDGARQSTSFRRSLG